MKEFGLESKVLHHYASSVRMQKCVLGTKGDAAPSGPLLWSNRYCDRCVHNQMVLGILPNGAGHTRRYIKRVRTGMKSTSAINAGRSERKEHKVCCTPYPEAGEKALATLRRYRAQMEGNDF